ncbi:hypothetical protein [Bacteroides ovatus]|jgi:hypothetical protein|uniref:hypothetical protein n=1 Tax=Bacteroides ovatus TaxID=28116 RepID=UPI0020A7F046|nr:hypothetical protein [Bacteroides ovatus]CAG9926642.1 hypothetical protein BOVAC16_4408 [Bacteroides ovatus]
MRTAEMNYHVTIKYPDNICFVFNPQIVQLSGGLLAGGMSLETYIYEIVDNDTSFKYTDNRVSVSDNISLDLSTYLQSLFDAKSSLPQSKKVKVTVTHNIGGLFEFTLLCIWGAMNVGEVFNPSRTVTMFRNFPSCISIYSNGEINVRYDGEKYTSVKVEDSGLLHKDFSEEFKDAKEFGMIKILNTPEAPSIFQYTFDRTFKPIPDDAVFIKVLFNDCDKGIYLRWLDRHGFFQYWLFQEGDLTGQASNEGELLNIDYSDIKYAYNGMSRYQGKTYQTTRKACATFVDRKIFKMLSTIHSSPIVDMYIGENWVPVNIVAGSFTDNGADLQDFEIQITMPKTITQML